MESNQKLKKKKKETKKENPSKRLMTKTNKITENRARKYEMKKKEKIILT